MNDQTAREPDLAEPETGAALEAQIYDRIHAAIFDRKLAPGARLIEEQLAEVFNVKRSRIRVVLQALAREKIVILHRNKGAAVAHPGVAEAREVFAARRLVETSLVRQLVDVIDERGLKRLKAHLRKEDAAERRGDRSAEVRTSHDFHMLLGELSGNSVIAGIMKELLVRSALITAIYERRDAHVCSQCDHRKLIELIEQGDAEKVARAMHKHLIDIESFLMLEEEKKLILDLRDVFAS